MALAIGVFLSSSWRKFIQIGMSYLWLWFPVLSPLSGLSWGCW